MSIIGALLFSSFAFGVVGISDQPIEVHVKRPANPPPCRIERIEQLAPMHAAWQLPILLQPSFAVLDDGPSRIAPHHPCDHPCGVSAVAPGGVDVGQPPELLVPVHFVPCSSKKK